MNLQPLLSALSDVNATPVDWWFIYKYPHKVGPAPGSTGFEFLYMDSNSITGPQLSTVTLDHDQCAVAATLKQIFSEGTTAGYILWNDEIPPSPAVPNPSDNGAKAHSKGILGFDKASDSGFYLLHSTPRFPLAGSIDLPEMEEQYGQTYLCISIDYATANVIAEILRLQHDVQVYAHVLNNVTADESIAKLANGDNQPVPSQPAAIPLQSRNGQNFSFFAKNKVWSEPPSTGAVGLDFWSDLVGPTLKVSMNVETWRRGTVFSDVDQGFNGDTLDVLSINLSPLGIAGVQWPYTKDHAKWGISAEAAKPYVVVGDINRNVSQENRGGGALCFENALLWKALHDIEGVEKDVRSDVHTDSSKDPEVSPP